MWRLVVLDLGLPYRFLYCPPLNFRGPRPHWSLVTQPGRSDVMPPWWCTALLTFDVKLILNVRCNQPSSLVWQCGDRSCTHLTTAVASSLSSESTVKRIGKQPTTENPLVHILGSRKTMANASVVRLYQRGRRTYMEYHERLCGINRRRLRVRRRFSEQSAYHPAAPRMCSRVSTQAWKLKRRLLTRLLGVNCMREWSPT